MEQQSKNWWESRTIVAGLTAMFFSTLTLFGVEIPVGDQMLISDMVFQVITLVAGMIAVYGRAVAKQPIAPVVEDTPAE